MIISSAPVGDDLTGDVQDDTELAGSTELRHIDTPLKCHGARLDRALADTVPEFSRSYLQQLIGEGAVQINGAKATKPSVKVKVGDVLQVELRPTPQSIAFKPEAIDLEVVFEDDFLLVVNKPAGLVVHPAPGNWSGTLLNGLLARDPQACLLPRAGIVHRLDKDTSGLMVVARQRQVMDQLVQMIASRTVSRQYVCLAHGNWLGAKTRQVNLPLGRDPRNRLRMAVVDLQKTSGKQASTDFALLDKTPLHCLVHCRLHTGRTHQIRVHMASLGHSLLADELYGGKADAGLQRQALHACRLAFKHPVTGEALTFESPVPKDIFDAMGRLGLIYTEKIEFACPSNPS